MHYRSTLVLVASLLLCYQSYAQIRQKADIEHATVFLNGAELYSTARVSLPQGESEVIFSNIAGNVNQQSLTIGADNDVVVQSAIFQNNYLQEDAASPVVKAMEDSIEQLTEKWEILNSKLTTVNEQIAILTENRKVTGQNTGLSVAELQRMLDLVSSKMEGLLNNKRKTMKDMGDLSMRTEKIRRQVEEERKKGFQPGGQLLVKFYAPKGTSSNIKLSYVVPNAGWKPGYDIRVEDLSKPVKLFYKANVYQNSGVKWDNIHITLSTGNPNESAQAPALATWRLGYYQQPVAQNYGYTNNANATYSAEQISKMPTRNTADAASLTGGVYQPKDGSSLSIGGARSNGTLYVIDGVLTSGASNSTMNQYVAVDNSGVNTSFDIDLPYTIPSDGKEQLVAIKTYNLPATYRHFAVPKLDKDAFLQAQVTDWEDLNLLPAPTNIFYEGSYVGQGFIDMRNVKDTMNISLGRDKKVIVRREIDKKLRSVKTIGNNVRENMAFAIGVKNTRKERINLTLMDQFPISIEKDIEIEDKQAKEATIDDTDGSVKWVMDLAPSELKEVKLSYTVKYPKGRSLGNYR